MVFLLAGSCLRRRGLLGGPPPPGAVRRRFQLFQLGADRQQRRFRHRAVQRAGHRLQPLLQLGRYPDPRFGMFLGFFHGPFVIQGDTYWQASICTTPTPFRLARAPVRKPRAGTLRGLWYLPPIMRKDTAIPFRLDAATKQRLQAAADRMGLSTSALVRILIGSFVRSFEASGGRATLPLEWPPAPPPPTPPKATPAAPPPPPLGRSKA